MTRARSIRLALLAALISLGVVLASVGPAAASEYRGSFWTGHSVCSGSDGGRIDTQMYYVNRGLSQHAAGNYAYETTVRGMAVSTSKRGYIRTLRWDLYDNKNANLASGLNTLGGSLLSVYYSYPDQWTPIFVGVLGTRRGLYVGYRVTMSSGASCQGYLNIADPGTLPA